MKLRTSSRSCDSCTLCCWLLRIDSVPGFTTTFDLGEDIAKPQGVSCRFLKKTGCSIYQNRPIVCRKFLCDFMLGKKNLDRHPKETGMIHMQKTVFSIDANF